MKGIKKDIFFSLLASILSCFVSCASAATGEPPYIWLTESSKYTLLPPENIENPIDNHQLVSASYGGLDYQINAWVKADETEIDITLLNELGANMGELIWRGGTVSFSSPVFPKSINPKYIVADFQLCFYKTDALRQSLEKGGLSFEETESVRRVINGDTAIIEIVKGVNKIKFVNHLRGYAYTLEGGF